MGAAELPGCARLELAQGVVPLNPEEAVFEATVRSFSRAARERVQVASVRLCEAIAAAHGLTADAQYKTEYPVTVNDAAQAAEVDRRPWPTGHSAPERRTAEEGAGRSAVRGRAVPPGLRVR